MEGPGLTSRRELLPTGYKENQAMKVMFQTARHHAPGEWRDTGPNQPAGDLHFDWL